MLAAYIGHGQRTVAPMKGIPSALVGLRALEVWQHVIPAPADIAGGLPTLGILLLPADIHHAIDRTGAAQRAASRDIHLAMIQIGFWLGLELPIKLRIEHRLAISDGDMDPHVG